jgi:predicted RNase H-like HicB family nuclease
MNRRKVMTATEYLRRPYARRLTPNEEGGYVATIQEFPGLVAEGETAEKSIAALEQAARSWIEAALGSGQKIPEPVALTGYSGKVALRMPRGLHKRAAEMASAEGCSLNQFLVTAVSYYVGGRELSKKAIEVMVSNSWNITTNNFVRFNVDAGFESVQVGGAGTVYFGGGASAIGPTVQQGREMFGIRMATTPALGQALSFNRVAGDQNG